MPRDQPNSSCSGSISRPGVARKPAAPMIVTKATAATNQARCRRRGAGAGPWTPEGWVGGRVTVTRTMPGAWRPTATSGPKANHVQGSGHGTGRRPHRIAVLALDGRPLRPRHPTAIFGCRPRRRRPPATTASGSLHPGRRPGPHAGGLHGPARRTARRSSTDGRHGRGPGIYTGPALTTARSTRRWPRRCARMPRRGTGSCPSAPARSCSPPPGCWTAGRPPPTGRTRTASAALPEVAARPGRAVRRRRRRADLRGRRRRASTCACTSCAATTAAAVANEVARRERGAAAPRRRPGPVHRAPACPRPAGDHAPPPTRAWALERLRRAARAAATWPSRRR